MFYRLVIISRVRPLAPMLLTRADKWPAGGDWALEPKWDGYRLVAGVEGGHGRCWTRHGTELTSRLGGLVDELVELLPDGSVIDGELVALARGRGGEPGQDFNRLSGRSLGAPTTTSASWSLTRCSWRANS